MTTEVSRHTFKKLGTIVEHLMKNINLSMYQVSCSGDHFGIRIQIWPLNYATQTPLWYCTWSHNFNGKLQIDSNFLRGGAEW